MSELDKQMYKLIKRLFPICRSITGNGVRKTLSIIQEEIPIDQKEIASGTKVFDWTVPGEWNIKDAYVKDEKGNRIIDFKKSDLHIVGYSIPFRGKLSLKELKEHLYTLPEQPELIPYITSYYKKIWGFCLAHNVYKKLKKGIYEVNIDSTLQPGSLTYGELIIKGKTDEEILISTYICHPSLANNELSGPVISTYLAKYLLNRNEKARYTYRIIFIPETIGSISYLSLHKDHLKKNVVGGYVVTCIGDPGPFSYLQTRQENTLIDRVTIHALKNSDKEYKIYNFLERGSDERQYNSPGIDLPIGSLMRTKYGRYSEYHTSADNLDFITPKALFESLEMYKLCINILEKNYKYITTIPCEPQLGKRGLYPTLSTKTSGKSVRNMMNLLAYCDGKNDLLWIAEKIDRPIWSLFLIVEQLMNNKLIKIVKECK
jgi:aminopeptidase-like protein